jgi:hypothetical protein
MSRQYKITGQELPPYRCAGKHLPSPEEALQPQLAVRSKDSEEPQSRQPPNCHGIAAYGVYVAETTQIYD